MAFVREKISEEDFEKYQIGRYDERIPNSLSPNAAHWAIDRQREIYLAAASNGPKDPETLDYYKFIFYLNGDVFTVSLSIHLSKVGDKHWLRECKQRSWNFIPYFSTSPTSQHMTEVKNSFKEAMIVYRRPGEDNDSRLDFTFDF